MLYELLDKIRLVGGNVVEILWKCWSF